MFYSLRIMVTIVRRAKPWSKSLLLFMFGYIFKNLFEHSLANRVMKGSKKKRGTLAPHHYHLFGLAQHKEEYLWR